MTAISAVFVLLMIVLTFGQWVAAVYVATEIGHSKGRSGLFWGLVFGWLGVAAVYALPDGKRGAPWRGQQS